MNIARTLFIFLFFILSFTSLSVAQNSPIENSSPAVQSQISERERQNNPANTVQNEIANTNCANVNAGAIIVVADTSPSVKDQLSEIKSRSKEIIALAPACVHLGVVSINAEAIKKPFDDKSEAGKFIDTITVGGKYTDLNRGNDAALSLLPVSGKSVIVFMTDGKATVPSSFKNKDGFIEILRREYSTRANVRVFVLNVKGEPLTKDEQLPANVTIIPIADWRAAKSVIAEMLAPQIKQHTTQNTSGNKPESEKAEKPEEPQTNNNLIYISAGTITLAALATIFIVWRKRRNRLQLSQELQPDDLPENILRDEDLQQPAIQETESETVLMIEAVNNRDEKFSFSPLRSFVNISERLTIGGSRLLAGMHLAELFQSQTLEISFDGKTANIIRLRPADGESLDAVLLNDQTAPKSFQLNPNESSRLFVGGYELKFNLTNESMVKLFDTSSRTDSVMLGNNQMAAQLEEPRMPRRRMRSRF